jgi:hypothetical protein
MATFDPDAFLAQGAPAAPAAGGFDPDVFLAQAAPAAPKKGKTAGQFLGNVAGAVARGAGSIGATILAPVDAAARYLNDGRPVNVGGFDIVGQDRREGMDQGLTSAGVDINSPEFRVVKLGTEIAGTAGAGGALANAVGRVLPAAVTAGPRVAQAIQALRTGGFSLGSPAATTAAGRAADLGIRTAGGAVNGLVSAGMVNPDDAATGALVGGALPGVVKAAGAAGNALRNAVGGTVKNSLGLMSGVGGEAVSTAYQSGKKGGTNFLENMRGDAPITDVLDSAKGALSKMRIDKSNAYRSGMVDIRNDRAVLDFAPIDGVVAGIKSMGNFRGQVTNKNAAGTVNEIADVVSQWKSLNPTEFHTPEGLDALKQSIGDIRDATQFGTPGRRAADQAYNAVKAQITAQAPTYSKVMKDYSQAAEQIKEVEKALSLGNKASADTSMRKLQSLMRNNVNTNYGNRLTSADALERNGAEILPAVAGQAMSSWTPRGLASTGAMGSIAAGLPTGGASLATLPLQSPRLVGELAYGLGAANRGVASGADAARNKLAALLGGTGGAGVPRLTRQELNQLLVSSGVLGSTTALVNQR